MDIKNKAFIFAQQFNYIVIKLFKISNACKEKLKVFNYLKKNILIFIWILKIFALPLHTDLIE